jgi:hypothetical protein
VIAGLDLISIMRGLWVESNNIREKGCARQPEQFDCEWRL